MSPTITQLWNRRQQRLKDAETGCNGSNCSGCDFRFACSKSPWQKRLLKDRKILDKRSEHQNLPGQKLCECHFPKVKPEQLRSPLESYLRTQR